MPKLEFKVVASRNVVVFETDLAKLVADGWKIEGNLCVSSPVSGGTTLYMLVSRKVKELTK